MYPRPTILRSLTNIGTISSTSVFSRARSHSGGASFSPGRPAPGRPGSPGVTGDLCCTFFRPTSWTRLSLPSSRSAIGRFNRYYLTQPNPFHISPLSDQVLGAVVMWVVGSFVFLVPATLITFTLLQEPSTCTA